MKYQPRETKEAHVRRMLAHLESHLRGGKKPLPADPFEGFRDDDDGPSLEMQREMNRSRKERG